MIPSLLCYSGGERLKKAGAVFELLASRFAIGMVFVFLLWGGSTCSLAASAADSYEITVKKAPPGVKQRNLEMGHLVGKAPKMHKNEKGVTVSKFMLKVRFEIDIVSKQNSGDNFIVVLRPTRTLIQLSLPITIWIPLGAPKRLVEHENGHRSIAERIYEDADDIARYHAAAVLKDTFEGRGATEAEAIQIAYTKAAVKLNREYRSAVYDYSRCVNEEYDRITRHGLEDIDPQVAVNKSFGKCSEYLSILGEARKSVRAGEHVWQRARPVTPIKRNSAEDSGSDVEKKRGD